jgi:ZU5 domain
MPIRRTYLLLLLLIPCLFIASCSDDDDPVDPGNNDPIVEAIGTSGGTIEITGEASLEIPAGALDQNTQFALGLSPNPPTDPEGRDLVSPIYGIGPSGTTFSQPATITLTYLERDLNGQAEEDIIIYTYSDNEWTPLITTVDTANNRASAQTMHLSDFTATTAGGEAADGVFAQFEVFRLVTQEITGSVQRIDVAMARFDSVVNLCSVVAPRHPESVSCNQWDLVWESFGEVYMDNNGSVDFLELDEEYTFTVVASDEVPALTTSITFPDLEPFITNISSNDVVSTEGFTVEWDNTGTGDVTLGLAVCEPEDPSLQVVTENDGSYTFTASQLSDLPPGQYILYLMYFNTEKINAAGYDPASLVTAGVMDFMTVNLGSGNAAIGSGGGTISLGDEGYLNIPENALTASVQFTAELNTSPTPAPDGWQFLTGVYTVEPSGTTFAVDAVLGFNYEESAIGAADEDDIVIFTDTGSGWTQLVSDVYDIYDNVEADIDHLSDFVAMIPVDIPADGVYADVLFERLISQVASDFVSRQDWISTRFDAVYNPLASVSPLTPDGVNVGAWNFVWDTEETQYRYSIVEAEALEFLTLGLDYSMTVDGNVDVPDLTLPATFVSTEPHINNLFGFDTVDLNGFTVEWAGTGPGTVTLSIFDPDDERITPTVEIVTDNDGSYTFSADDLADVSGPMIWLVLEDITETAIDAAGYDSRSRLICHTLNEVALNAN